MPSAREALGERQVTEVRNTKRYVPYFRFTLSSVLLYHEVRDTLHK